MSEHPAVTPTATPHPTPHPRRWQILAFLGIAQLMLILDVTVVAIALPHLGADLGLDRATLTWVVSAYTLTFGGLMLLGGRLADLFGARRIVVTGLVVFTAASLLTGLVPDGTWVLAGRIGQGIGAALLSPSALSWVIALFDGEERNRALGIWSALGGGGAALGVLAGGLLTAGPGWPWVFFVNVPVGLIILVALVRLLPRPTPVRHGSRLDVLGAVLVTAATGSLIFALIRAGEHGWLTIEFGLLLVVSAALYTAFVAWQRRHHSPLMDVRLLARRPVATGAFLIAMATALMIAVFFLGTFYFQQHLGYSALTTGLLFLPVALATMLGATLAGRLIARLGARALGAAGLITAAAGLALAGLWLAPLTAVIGIAVAAAGTGVIFVVASATALGQVEPEVAGVASGIVSTFHEFGASIGAAVMSSLAAASITGSTNDGFTQALIVAAIAAIAGAVVTLVITPRPAPAVTAASS